MQNAILIVDDEPDILEEACEALTGEGYAVHCAGGVNRALEILGANPEISLVVTDLKMPGKSGPDLIREVRRDPGRRIAFIVMSGHGSPSVKADGINIEDFPFLRKPLDIEELIEAVDRAFSNNTG